MQDLTDDSSDGRLDGGQAPTPTPPPRRRSPTLALVDQKFRTWVLGETPQASQPPPRVGFGSGAVPVSDTPLADAGAADQVRQLERALVTRTVIAQGVGILMERFDLSADDAFDVLRTASNDRNRKLRDLAAELTTDRSQGDTWLLRWRDNRERG